MNKVNKIDYTGNPKMLAWQRTEELVLQKQSAQKDYGKHYGNYATSEIWMADKVHYMQVDCPEWKGTGVVMGQDGTEEHGHSARTGDYW